MFHSDQALRDLEQILHPPIRGLIKQRIQAAIQEHSERLIVVDIPLLYESNWQTLFSEIMVVYIPEELQIERLMQRDQIDRQEAKNRLSKQWPIERKRELANIVIDNSQSLEHTIQQIEKFWSGKGLT